MYNGALKNLVQNHALEILSSFSFYIQKIGLKIYFIPNFISKIIKYRVPIIKQWSCFAYYPHWSPVCGIFVFVEKTA